MSLSRLIVIENLVSACQVTVGKVCDWSEPPDAEIFLEPFREISLPRSPAEGVMVHSILSTLVNGLGTRLHRNFHLRDGKAWSRCDFKNPGLVAAAMHESLTLSALSVLEGWLNEYRQEFDRAHASLPRKARQHLQRYYAEAITVSSLASVFNVEPRTLQRAFHRATGFHVKEYHLRLRVANALPLLCRGDKVEAVARIVGWRSKKDLYRAIARCVALSPSEIRTLAPGTVNQMVCTLLTPARHNMAVAATYRQRGRA